MFSIPRVNVIESDKGFSVEVLGRVGLRYTENNRTMTVDSEVLEGPSAIVLYTDSIKTWDHPHRLDFMDEAVRQRIVENIRDAFRFRGMEIQVQ